MPCTVQRFWGGRLPQIHLSHKEARSAWCKFLKNSKRSTNITRTATIHEVYEISDAASVLRYTLSFSATLAALAALGLSASPLVSRSDTRKAELRSLTETDEVGVKWGAMSVISCLPLLNWLAWIFAALENEERSSFYYALAVTYAVPQLCSGFEQNWLSVLSIVVGIAHVQVERISEERGVARSIKFKGDVREVSAKAQNLLSASGRAFSEALKDDKNSSNDLIDCTDDSLKEELTSWDERLKARDNNKTK